VIIFDSSFLVILLHSSPPPAKDRDNKPVTQFKERVAHLAATMDVKNDIIGVPAPAMAEILVRAGNGRAKFVSVLSDTWKFQILPFDARAAIEASELIAKIKSNKEPWDTWAKVKFDIQIVSIAKAEGVGVIYADDRDIENYADRLKIKVVRICDLPLPPPPEPEPKEKLPLLAGAQGELPLVSATKAPAQAEDKPSESPTAEADKGEKSATKEQEK
jgi:predicted nucleic acid-binding protein